MTLKEVIIRVNHSMGTENEVVFNDVDLKNEEGYRHWDTGGGDDLTMCHRGLFYQAMVGMVGFLMRAKAFQSSTEQNLNWAIRLYTGRQ